MIRIEGIPIVAARLAGAQKVKTTRVRNKRTGKTAPVVRATRRPETKVA
jgi:hypothetical protein